MWQPRHFLKFRFFVGTKLLLAVRVVFRLLPSRLGLALAAAVGRQTRHFCAREVKIAIAQYRYVMGSAAAGSNAPPTADEREFVARVFAHVGESIGEVLTLDRIIAAELPHDPALPPWRRSLKFIRSEGQEVVDDLIRRKQSSITLSGHIGCFELLAAYHVAQGVPVTVAARDANYPWFDHFLDGLRSGYGVETVWRNDPNGARVLMRALKQGRVAAVLIDQDTSLDNTFSPFFGLDAAHPSAPIRLALRFRTPLFTSFIYRESRGYHRIVTEPLDYDPDDPDAPAKILKIYNQRLERQVKAHPEQWIWWHRRWRRRPGVDYAQFPDELPSTSRYLAWLKDQHRSSLDTTTANG